MSENLATVYSHGAVKDFGSTLRRALRMNDDYASLIELENAELPDDFADAVRKFLRRFEAFARSVRLPSGKQLRRPAEENLEQLMSLVDEHGVRIVRAALISHALVRGAREEIEETVLEEIKEVR